MKVKRYPKSYFAARRARVSASNDRKFSHAVTRAYRTLARGAGQIVVNPIDPAPLGYADVEVRLHHQDVENLQKALLHVAAGSLLP